MINRSFQYKGIRFHLNDNGRKNEFEGKYILLFFHEGYEAWLPLYSVNSKKEAIDIVKNLAISLERTFDER